MSTKTLIFLWFPVIPRILGLHGFHRFSRDQKRQKASYWFPKGVLKSCQKASAMSHTRLINKEIINQSIHKPRTELVIHYYYIYLLIMNYCPSFINYHLLMIASRWIRCFYTPELRFVFMFGIPWKNHTTGMSIHCLCVDPVFLRTCFDCRS